MAFLLNQGLSQVLAGGLEARIQRQRLAVTGHGGIDIATAGLHQSEVVPGIGVAGRMLQAEAEGFNRLGDAFVIPQQIGQAEGGLGITG